MKEAGVHILDNRTEILENGINTHKRLGTGTPLFPPTSHMPMTACFSGPNISKKYLVLPRAVNLLLAHNPSYFKEYAEWGADLVLVGHIHGGGYPDSVKGGLRP